MSRKIVLLTNGPGELWGWVRPFAAELLRRCWDVSLRILPCQFASGKSVALRSLSVFRMYQDRNRLSGRRFPCEKSG